MKINSLDFIGTLFCLERSTSPALPQYKPLPCVGEECYLTSLALESGAAHPPHLYASEARSVLMYFSTITEWD